MQSSARPVLVLVALVVLNVVVLLLAKMTIDRGRRDNHVPTTAVSAPPRVPAPSPAPHASPVAAADDSERRRLEMLKVLAETEKIQEETKKIQAETEKIRAETRLLQATP
jgi:hypothetical protein